MNNYIESDIEQGLKYLKVGIMNALADIESGEKEIILENYIPFSLIVKCAEEKGWESWSDDLSEDFDTNGWQGDCWYDMRLPNTNTKVTIYSCLWEGQESAIRIDETD